MNKKNESNESVRGRVLTLPQPAIEFFVKNSKVLAQFFYALGDAFKTLNARVESASMPRLSVKEQAFFIKRLSFLIKASVPILEGLSMVSEQTMSRRYARVIDSVLKDVSNGISLSRSLGKFPHIFGEFGINIIKVGESSGTLSQNLDYLADELHKKQVLKRKVMGALVYPAVITVATLAITGFLILYLFPKIMPIFASLKMELPITTQIVIAVSTFLQASGGWLVLGLVVAVTVIFGLHKQSEWFRFAFDQAVLRMPVFGVMFRYYSLANINRTLGLLLKSGITLAEALPLTADTTQNLVYRAELRHLATSVNRGEQLSKHLKKNRFLFPDVMTQMILIGERSGNLSNTLIYLSELYEAEVEDFTKNLSALIEPALMVIMGIVVGFVAVSIITPIYGITQNLGN